MPLSEYYQERLSLGDRKNTLTRLIAIQLIVFITLMMARTYFYFTRPEEAIALLEEFRAGSVSREKVLQAFQAAPVADLGFAWLDAHPLGTDRPLCLRHGDTGSHNMMSRDGHLAALIDWELAHIGDPTRSPRSSTACAPGR